jgi:ribosomal protein S1
MSGPVAVDVNDAVRTYEEDGWFFEGAVTSVTENGIMVDYGRFVSIHPLSQISVDHEGFQEILVADDKGTILIDRRNEALVPVAA